MGCLRRFKMRFRVFFLQGLPCRLYVPAAALLAKLLLFYYRKELKREAQAAVESPAHRTAVVAIRYTTVRRIAAPAATTKNAVRARRWTSRVRLRTAAVISIPVLTPLPYVARHIIQA